MRLYTRKGDRGVTALNPVSQVPKSDERVGALGDIDELESLLSLAVIPVGQCSFRTEIERIRKNLSTVSSGISSGDISKFVLPQDEIDHIEQEIDRIGADDKPDYTPSTELAAGLNLARAVARRAERTVCAVNRRVNVQINTIKYLNRLSDYFYSVALCADGVCGDGTYIALTAADKTASPTGAAAVAGRAVNRTVSNEQRIVEQVISRIGGEFMTLSLAEKLIKCVEDYAVSVGKRAVVAVCNAQGNPVAVHVMDGAYLVSFEVAVKKAYTAVAVKMPTIELAPLTAPGGTFEGLQKLEKIVVFGGGVPLMAGQAVIGGLGISGGTGEEDHALCEYALKIFPTLI